MSWPSRSPTSMGPGPSTSSCSIATPSRIPICCMRASGICTSKRNATRTPPMRIVPSSSRTVTMRSRRSCRCRRSTPMRRAVWGSWCCRARRSSSRTTAIAPPSGSTARRRASLKWWPSSRPTSGTSRPTITPRRSAPRTRRIIRRRSNGIAASSPRFPMIRTPRQRISCSPRRCSKARNTCRRPRSTRRPPTTMERMTRPPPPDTPPSSPTPSRKTP